MFYFLLIVAALLIIRALHLAVKHNKAHKVSSYKKPVKKAVNVNGSIYNV